MTLRFASTFLSHSSTDAALVTEVAMELARRGVLAWLDREHIRVGHGLTKELYGGVYSQSTTTAFISREYLASPWCEQELKWTGNGTSDRLAGVDPVFLGDATMLVKSSELLGSAWLTADGQLADKFGFQVGTSPAAAEVAGKIASSQYERLQLRNASAVVLVLDQRGNGAFMGVPEYIPRSWLDLPSSPAGLVFRPDRSERSPNAVVSESEWLSFSDTIVASLAEATGGRRRRDIYVTGMAQLAVAWLAGWFFDRSSCIRLVVHNSRREQYLCLDMNEKRFLSPRFVPSSTVTWDNPAEGATAREISAFIGNEIYEDQARSYRLATGDTTPLAVHHINDQIENAEQVVELAGWLNAASAARPVRLYSSLPFHAIPLLAALAKHGTGHVTLMEWDSSAKTYRACPMPLG